MNNKTFKDSMCEILEKNSFCNERNSYYFETKELIIIVSCQKSSYSNGYYINYGFLVKSINEDMERVKVNFCDVIGRFDGNEKDIFNIDSLDKKQFEKIIQKNINSIIKPVIEHGISKYFELYPEAMWTAKLKLKKYLKNK